MHGPWDLQCPLGKSLCETHLQTLKEKDEGREFSSPTSTLSRDLTGIASELGHSSLFFLVPISGNARFET